MDISACTCSISDFQEHVRVFQIPWRHLIPQLFLLSFWVNVLFAATVVLCLRYLPNRTIASVWTYTSEVNAFCTGQALPQVKQRQLCKWNPLAMSNNDNSLGIRLCRVPTLSVPLYVCQAAGSHCDCRLLVFKTAIELRWHWGESNRTI